MVYTSQNRLIILITFFVLTVLKWYDLILIITHNTNIIPMLQIRQQRLQENNSTEIELIIGKDRASI